MRFKVLAVDYDGTLARHGSVVPATLVAVERLRASGRKVILVTGREIEDLKLVFNRFDVFDHVVVENGAVLYDPVSDAIKKLHEPPAEDFVAELRRNNVPLSLGHVIVASRQPFDTIILQAIKKLGLELELIFNKGAVMVLPSGVNKATGLKVALQTAGVPPEETVGIGDAENDHAFLKLCGCGVAVSNALPSLKERAQLVTVASHGEGVAELIDRLILSDLRGMPQKKETAPSAHDPGVLLRHSAHAGAAP